MNKSYPYVVVGSGLTGATIARVLHDYGHRVLVLERRSHVGGNVHDYTHPSGITVHTYGPHYFRTGSERIWKFVNRFAEFYDYRPSIKSLVEGGYENWPVTKDYIRRSVGENWSPAFQGTARNFEEASLAMMPQKIYELFVKGYTEKQWGVEARALSASLARRFDVRETGDVELFRHVHQGIPRNGYAAFTRALLHGIPCETECDFLKERPYTASRKLIFTGPVDEFFQFRLGCLKYRGQKREHVFIPNQQWLQPCGQVNNPDHAKSTHIRTLEWKHMMDAAAARNIAGTLVTRETPYSPERAEDYEYPFPDEQNADLFSRYRALAEAEKDVIFCGRLGEYRYYDMDQAIARAILIAEKLLQADS